MSLKTLVGLTGLFISSTLAAPSEPSQLPKRATRKECLDLCRSVEAKLPGKVFYAGSAGFNASQNHYYTDNEREIIPGCVVRPTSTGDVSKFVKVVSSSKIAAKDAPFAIRSGGHTLWEGAANLQDGITLDMRLVNSFSLSKDKKVCSIGGGSNFADVYPKLVPHNLTVLGGRAPGVSAGGFLTGGGKNFLGRRHGYGADNIFGYEVVLASGEVVYASAGQSKDLWLALKGGSNNFGVVTRFDLATYPLDGMWSGAITFLYTPEVLNSQVQVWHDYMRVENFDDAADALLLFGYQSSMGFFISDTLSYSAPVVNPKVYQNFTSLPGAINTDMKLRSVAETVTFTGSLLPAQAGRGFELVYDFYNAPPAIYSQLLKIAEFETTKIKDIPGLTFLHLFQPSPVTNGTNSLGVAPNQKDLVLAVIGATWDSKADDNKVNDAIRSIVSQQEKLLQREKLWTPFKYMNYADISENSISTYGKENVKKLWAASKKYDPKGLFQRVPGYKLPK
ncbi:FAD oxidoreductase [Podospora fimiseda]|uniref:FAD oxidoreductase n=1 Tax=Podospora fimiseda TaxID=252190 RepID=A0AAN7BJ74_9PEZI|nr:FAD oxidoreductase [Podospora fimiseda]